TMERIELFCGLVSSYVFSNIADYEPGQFYKRELPCVLEARKAFELKKIDCIIHQLRNNSAIRD
ncbi:MAG: hypothetical protein AAF573_06855, partial [Bacteroidota bacterium]